MRARRASALHGGIVAQPRGARRPDQRCQRALGAGRIAGLETLPARVEGVIAERIGRLTDEARETLTIGSVMGRDFAAQVIAQVQEVPERELVKQLARELDKRHHLVQETGEIRIGKQFLSWYRFAHALFQQFLYNEMRRGSDVCCTATSPECWRRCMRITPTRLRRSWRVIIKKRAKTKRRSHT